MTRFIAGIIVLLVTVIVGVVAGGYLGYFVGMVYSLTNGWMFSLAPTTIANIFAAAGSLIFMIILALTWAEAYSQVKREQEFEKAMERVKEKMRRR